MFVWLCEASHVPSAAEVQLLRMGLAWALFLATQIWIVHIALEPYVRQFWPNTLVSWNRVVHGRFADALVGRHVLLGCLCGVAIMLNDQFAVMCGAWFSVPTRQAMDIGMWGRLDSMLNALVGQRYALAQLLLTQVWAIRIVWFYGMTSVLFFRLIFRSDWLAAIGFAAAYTFVFTLDEGGANGNWVTMIPLVLPKIALFAFLFLRCGILPAVMMVLVRLLLAFPLTANPTASYFYVSLSAIIVVVALAGFGAYCSNVKASTDESGSTEEDA
jgi:hypothetical protein